MMQKLEKDTHKSPVSILKKLRELQPKLHFEPIPVPGYELVLKITEPSVDLQAIIAVHSTKLGPALGGTRIYPYTDFSNALEDVLRLSQSMTYKASLSGVGIGGGKSVILAHPSKKTPQLLETFGLAVDALEGMYICAEDVGCSVQDMQYIHKTTKYVTGLEDANSSGDPSPFTAWGTFLGIQAALKKVYNSTCLRGKKIAIQGLGNVGMCLARNLFWAGATLFVADLDEESTKKAKSQFGATIVPPEEILRTECDVFAPCAMGGILHKSSIPSLRCKIVAGGANNQLLQEEDGIRLFQRKILYAPDFVINAGGLINVASEIAFDGYNPMQVRNDVYEIYERLSSIFAISEKNGISTHEAAESLAKYRVKYGIGKRTKPAMFRLG